MNWKKSEIDFELQWLNEINTYLTLLYWYDLEDSQLNDDDKCN